MFDGVKYIAKNISSVGAKHYFRSLYACSIAFIVATNNQKSWPTSVTDLVTSAPSVAVFRSRLKTHLFNISYPSPLWLYSACAVTLCCFGHYNRSYLLTYLLPGFDDVVSCSNWKLLRPGLLSGLPFLSFCIFCPLFLTLNRSTLCAASSILARWRHNVIELWNTF